VGVECTSDTLSSRFLLGEWRGVLTHYLNGHLFRQLQFQLNAAASL